VYVYLGLIQSSLLPLSKLTPSYIKVTNSNGQFCPPNVISQDMPMHIWTENFVQQRKIKKHASNRRFSVSQTLSLEKAEIMLNGACFVV
jgi:hypothetical protein